MPEKMPPKPKGEQEPREATRLGEAHGTEPSPGEVREDVRQGQRPEDERREEKKT